MFKSDGRQTNDGWACKYLYNWRRQEFECTDFSKPDIDLNYVPHIQSPAVHKLRERYGNGFF